MFQSEDELNKIPFAICPHHDAPLFKNYEESQLIIKQLITQVQSSHMALSSELRMYLRQLSLVSLWFFLKYIAGFSGPYNKLNSNIHLEMANWRQSPSCMKPGARAAGFVPRSFYKSTIWTHGACIWEILRFPNIRIRLERSTIEFAIEFIGNIKDFFENNVIGHWLFPECVLPAGYRLTGKWASNRIVIPSRTRYFGDATVTAGSTSGASEGGHNNLYISDDPIGMDDLNSEMCSNVDMYRKKTRYINNKTSLLDEALKDRNLLVGTRYAVDDIYDIPINDAYEFVGYMLPNFKIKENGEWSVYNRLAEEDGIYIYPEKVNQIILEKAMQENMWYAMTQLMNNPQKTGLSELIDMKPRMARIVYSDKYNDWIITFIGDPNYGQETEYELLRNCDVVMSIDPAFTDKGISAKTSRTSIGIWAHDSKDRVVRIYSKVGYFATSFAFDMIFEGHKQFPGYIRKTIIETNAQQKLLIPLLETEQITRNIYLGLSKQPSSVDKTVRIRNTLGIRLAKGQIYLCEGCAKEFLEEHMIFPMNEYKMDVLDESQKGISGSYKPASSAEIIEREERDAEQIVLTDNMFGY